MSPTSDKAFNVAIPVLHVVMSPASPQAFSSQCIDCMLDVLLIYLHWNVCVPTPPPPISIALLNVVVASLNFPSHCVESEIWIFWKKHNIEFINQNTCIINSTAESYSKLDRSYYLKPPIGILNLPSTTTFIVWLQQLRHSDPGLGRFTGDLLSSYNYFIPIRA